MTKGTRIGIVGGTGLYDLEELADVRRVDVETPFGKPSDAYVTGTLHGVPVAFLPRHGAGHRIPPSDVNYRANIFGFKMLGVERIIAVTAVGSLREEIAPLHIVIPDQFLDRTFSRIGTFFGEGLVAHVSFAEPVCPHLSRLISDGAVSAGAVVHKGGTMVCIEGPAFSTRAEAELHRSWGMDIIGMTAVQEARLSREAEICYALLSLVTDYDCWHDASEEVSVGQVMENLSRNTVMAGKIVSQVVGALPQARGCRCGDALEGAIITDPAAMDPAMRAKLAPIVGKYLD